MSSHSFANTSIIRQAEKKHLSYLSTKPSKAVKKNLHKPHTPARRQDRTHTRTHARTHASTHAPTLAPTHARTRARTHARTHTHRHTHTHTLTVTQLHLVLSEQHRGTERLADTSLTSQLVGV